MLAVACLRPNPRAVAFVIDPSNLDPCGTSIRPSTLTGAIIVASIGSPVCEIREPVGPDRRASRTVPAGNSNADTATGNRSNEPARKPNSRVTATIAVSHAEPPIVFYLVKYKRLMMATVRLCAGLNLRSPPACANVQRNKPTQDRKALARSG